MHGDFTRETFDAQQHYWGVLHMQGRVDLDADRNEQAAVVRYQTQARTADLLGWAGGPGPGSGFAMQVDAAGAVTITRGHYYVDGILCENEADVAYGAQPHPTGQPLPAAAGLHVVYLDVWDRHVTALQRPVIREVALGGPDTTTRGQTIWQVRTGPLTVPAAELTPALAALAAATTPEQRRAALATLQALALGALCDSPFPRYGGSLEPGTGAMAARTVVVDDPADPCRFTARGGYRALENRLYRMEIHRAGDETAATGKWSRDNGAVAVAVEEYLVAAGASTTTRLRVRRIGADEQLSVGFDDHVEIVADDDVLAGRSGTLARIVNDPEPADRIVELDTAVTPKAPGLHPIVRPWDGTVAAPLPSTFTELEEGVQVRFDAGTYHSGDYWQIPARANIGDIEWPPHPAFVGEEVTAAPLSLPPAGVAHRFATIGVLIHDGTRVAAAADLRALHPAVTDLTTIDHAGGDGQEPRQPGAALPQPIQVRVHNGNVPVPGRRVRFRVVTGDAGQFGAGLLIAGAQAAAEVTVAADTDGLAGVLWNVDRTSPDHRAEARLLDDCESVTGPPVFFTASVNFALDCMGGDGQQGGPGERLAPLRVWVHDGGRPVEGASVRFTVTAGTGTLGPVAPTDADGITTCEWTLDATTRRQQVEAQLYNPNGILVHAASYVFTADLDRGGGECTVVVPRGASLDAFFADLALPTSGFTEGSICLPAGTFQVKAPLVVVGPGHVTVSGAGHATRIEAPDTASALVFQKCAGATVRNLFASSGLARTGQGRQGVLDFVDCGRVSVEDVAIATPSGAEPATAGIVVRNEVGGRVPPVRVRSCEIAVGEQQGGILVVNAGRILVEDTAIGAQMAAPDLIRLVVNRRFRAGVREKLVSFAEPRAGDTPRPPGDRSVVITVRVGDETLTFRSEVGDVDVWREEIAARQPRTLARAREVAEEIADEVVRNEGVLGPRRVFRTWWEELRDVRFRVTGDSGIVIGGVVAEEVRILHNSIAGVLRAVSVGLSDAEGARLQPGVVQVTGNTVALPSDSVVAGFAAGVLVGNPASLVVRDNAIDAGETRPSIATRGVRVIGALGPRMIVAVNHFGNTDVAVLVQPDQPSPDVPRRWLVTENVATRGTLLAAPCEVVEDNNVPPRPSPCLPADRPAL